MAHTDKTFRMFRVTKEEQQKITEVMEAYGNRIAKGETVSYSEFERDIISVFGGNIVAMKHEPSIDYLFCEYVAKAFMEDGRWREVFYALYGKFPKYGEKNGNQTKFGNIKNYLNFEMKYTII